MTVLGARRRRAGRGHSGEVHAEQRAPPVGSEGRRRRPAREASWYPPLDSQNPRQYSDHRGFVYRVKGFTIGDNRQLLPAFKVGSSTLYWWYTGEIYVLDHNVIPNAARDAFEMTPERLQLDKAVTDQLRQLDREASDYQKKTLAEKKVKEAVDAAVEDANEVVDGLGDALGRERPKG